MKTTRSLYRVLVGAGSLALFAGHVRVSAQDRPPGRRGARRRVSVGRAVNAVEMAGRPGMMNPLFAALDTNGDGVIDAAEIADASAALKKLDKNGDGKITQDEVRPAFGPRGGPEGRGGFEGRGGPEGRDGPGGPGIGAPSADEIVTRMMQFDKNGDGKLSKDELPPRMAAMMERGDLDKDGFLSRDELVALAKAQLAAGGGPGGERERR